jgi:deoxyribodipyrimidine photolyase-like uncharacterized protein
MVALHLLIFLNQRVGFIYNCAPKNIQKWYNIEMAGNFYHISVAAGAGMGQKVDEGGILFKERYQSDNFKL